MNSDEEIGQHSFKCGVFDVEPSRSLLFLDGNSYSLEPRIMDVLCVLAEQSGEVLSREDLIDRIWKVEFGADESLTRAISILRKTFKKAGAKDTYIETFPKRGYRLAQPVGLNVETPSTTIIDKRAPQNLKDTEVVNTAHFTTDLTHAVNDTYSVPKKNLVVWLSVGFFAVLTFIGIFTFFNDPNPTSVSRSSEKSIAVLPFEDYSPSKDQAYFADGIAEELLNVLARIDGLRVASRTSSFSYRDSSNNMENIGKDLDVGHILEGSVRKIGGTVRISAQLIDTKTDEHIWSSTYDRVLTAENIFAVQDDISRAIASELKVRMDITQTAKGPPTNSTEALEAYLKGKALYEPRTKQAIDDSIQQLEQAVALDPEFANAHATLARVYMMASEYGTMNPNLAFSRAGVHLETAIKLAPNSSESLIAKARVLFQQRQYLLAFEYFNIATVSDPLDTEAWRGKGLSLRELGRLDEAKEALEQALQINPLSSIIHLNLSNVEMYRENLDVAIANVENALVMDPQNVAAHEHLSMLTLSKGDYPGAHNLFLENLAKLPRISNHLQRLYYMIGRPDLEAASMDWINRAYIAFNAGDATEASRLARGAKNPGPYAQIVEVLYNAGQLDEAYESVKRDRVQLQIFANSTPIGAYNEKVAILYYKVLSAKTDPFAVVLFDKLVQRFENKQPLDFELPSSLAAGASWQLINGSEDELLVWLQAMNDRGILWRQFEFDPLYEKYTTSPRIEKKWEHMEMNAAKYSDAIDLQLMTEN